MNSEYRLEISDLSLIRGWQRAVSGFSANIAAGQGLWLSGANGAGKTSLLRALAGFLRPEAGNIILHDDASIITPRDENYRDHILFLPARAPLKAVLTVREQWQLWQEMFKRNDEIPPPLNLHNHLDQRIGKLSAGQQRRLALALLALTNRKIWLLDEAFNHLDDAGENWLMQQIYNHRAVGGITIIAAPIAAYSDFFTQMKL